MPGRRLAQCLDAQLQLAGHESLIMQQSEIGAIANSDQGLPALRQMQAGMRHARAACEPAVFAAQQDSGNLAADRSLLVRRANPARHQIQHWEEFEDVADHCTVCHKCYNPCPVDIDFGDVSMKMRDLLRKHG